MKCPDVQEQLSRWLDGEMPEPEANSIQAHLDQCPVCQGELEGLRRLDAALAELQVPVPSGLAEKVLERLGRRATPWYRHLALAACLILGIFLGGTLTGTLYRVPGLLNGNGNDLAALEVFQDFPQGSLGTAVSYPDEDGSA